MPVSLKPCWLITSLLHSIINSQSQSPLPLIEKWGSLGYRQTDVDLYLPWRVSLNSPWFLKCCTRPLSVWPLYPPTAVGAPMLSPARLVYMHIGTREMQSIYHFSCIIFLTDLLVTGGKWWAGSLPKYKTMLCYTGGLQDSKSTYACTPIWRLLEFACNLQEKIKCAGSLVTLTVHQNGCYVSQKW